MTPSADLARWATLVATVATGLSAGFFVTYQISVTRGLAITDDLTYLTAFQAINETVRTGWFAAFFFGAMPLLVVAAVLARGSSRWLLAAGAALYLGGVLVVTFAGNVPMNNELAAVADLAGADLAQVRADFEDRWNQLNLVRTLASVLVFVLAVLAQRNVTARCTQVESTRIPTFS